MQCRNCETEFEGSADRVLCPSCVNEATGHLAAEVAVRTSERAVEWSLSQLRRRHLEEAARLVCTFGCGSNSPPKRRVTDDDYIWSHVRGEWLESRCAASEIWEELHNQAAGSPADPSLWYVGLRANGFLEDLEATARDECGEAAADWRPSQHARVDDLSKAMTQVVWDWIERHCPVTFRPDPERFEAAQRIVLEDEP